MATLRLTLSSESTNINTSNWQGILRDVLIDIFLECLPTYPLLHKQPDVTKAPMILCQICSHWRYVALTFPKLWEQLYHISFVTQSGQLAPIILQNGIRSQDIDFLHWWSSNLGLRSPVLRLRLDRSKAMQGGGIMEEEQGAFFTKLLSSAKYLDLDPSYIIALQCWTQKSPLMYQNLNTLVLRYKDSTAAMMKSEGHEYSPVIPMEYAHSQNLHRLHLEHLSFSNTTPLNSLFTWSKLYHLSMLEIKLDIRLWFQLIRLCTHLRSAEIHIDTSDDDERSAIDYLTPHVILPNLHKLHLTLEDNQDHTRNVFVNVHFPHLTAFRLISRIVSKDELHSILSSTPALVELQLSGKIPYDRQRFQITFPAPDDTSDPLWKYLPSLKRLLLDGSTVNNHLVPVWLKALLRTGWLQLGMDTNSIKRLELGIANLSECTDERTRYETNLDNLVPGWTGIRGLSRERTSHTLGLLNRITESCGSEGVEIVLRDPTAPKIWSGMLLKEDEGPLFDVQGFSAAY